MITENASNGRVASYAVRYGIGFCTIEEGIIRTVEIKGVAVIVIECLRYLIPFSTWSKQWLLN